MMKYQVIARKFRPQVFAEVVGQRAIVRILKNAIQLNRIGHAYLFSGPRGVGKTTMARILAKGLNCVQGPTVQPCGECPSCKEIALSQSMDVLEIDAASNTGVDNVRDLRESARYAPSRDRYKIFIIDEVHMLSTAAFNALLKILEEPPSHVIFIMATTERQKLPATILSRCQQLVFRTIAAEEIQNHLRDIAGREGVHIGDGAVSYIVKAAEGSMRDAQSLLDQIISFGGQTVADEEVRDVLGFMPGDILDQTFDGIADGDSRGLLEIVDTVVSQGLNLHQYVKECISRARDLLMVKVGVPEKVLATDEEKAALAARAETFSEQDLIRFFDQLTRLESELRGTSQPRFHLEVGLVKLARTGHIRDIEEVIRDLKQGGQGPITPPAPAATPTRTPSSPSRNSFAPAVSPAPAPSNRPAVPKVSPPIAEKKDPPAKGEAEPFTFSDIFTRRVEQTSRATAGWLLKAHSVDRQADEVRILVAEEGTLATLNSQDHLPVLNEAAKELIGNDASVSLIIKGEAASRSERRPDQANPLESARDEPLVRRFLEVFRGDIAQIKPAKGE